MAKVRNPKNLSTVFGIKPAVLNRLGVLNATLAIDTRLFIDPLLFPGSAHAEIRSEAVAIYQQHFERVIKFLAATKKPEDVAWRSARRMLEFHEIRGTCLGYGAGSIQGSGFGRGLTERVLNVGKEIVDLGVVDPDLFPAMALFEADIGPDRISDMATNVARDALVAFNKRILGELNLAGESFRILDTDGEFLVNPYQRRRRTPVILVPTDVLRPLPIVHDWDGIASAASHNESLRRRVNQHISHIWASKSKREKRKLREQVFGTKQAFETLLRVIQSVPRVPYDAEDDPEGLVRWSQIATDYAAKHPLSFAKTKADDLESAYELVQQIIQRFRQLVENNGLNKELYANGRKARHESTAQRLFFAIAYCYCEAQKLDISPEVDSGSGRIDFKFSRGFNARVLVEVKLSKNSKLVSGYQTQLETYKKAEQAMRAFYLIIDVGRMGRKDKALIELRNTARKNGAPLSDLEFIDGKIKSSASKR